MKGRRVGEPLCAAPEGVEGLAGLHLDSDALRICKHARIMVGAKTATASWHSHSHLEEV
jgi:hypothetical protein